MSPIGRHVTGNVAVILHLIGRLLEHVQVVRHVFGCLVTDAGPRVARRIFVVWL